MPVPLILVAVAVWMTSIFSFSVAKLAYDPNAQGKVVVSQAVDRDQVYSVASTHIDVK